MTATTDKRRKAWWRVNCASCSRTSPRATSWCGVKNQVALSLDVGVAIRSLRGTCVSGADDAWTENSEVGPSHSSTRSPSIWSPLTGIDVFSVSPAEECQWSPLAARMVRDVTFLWQRQEAITCEQPYHERRSACAHRARSVQGCTTWEELTSNSKSQ